MFTKIMKWISIAALLLSLLWSSSTNNRVWSVEVGGYLELLVLVVFVTAILVVVQTVRAGKYFWAAGFAAISVLFNPIAPVTLSQKTFLWVGSVCIGMFLVSFALWKRRPRLSAVGSESDAGKRVAVKPASPGGLSASAMVERS